MNIFFEVIEKTGDYEGRFTRREFWLFTLWYYLSFVGSYICLNNPRLYDSGRSGWWQLVSLFPLVGWAFYMYFMVQPSEGDNKYGSIQSGSQEPIAQQV